MRAETKVFGTIALLLLLGLPAGAQEQKVDMRRPAGPGAPMRMIMATDDYKVFRLIRPTMAALQIGLAEAGYYFSGPVNGIMGPSTLEAMAAFQGAQGRAASGLPTLLDVLTLAGVDETALVEAFKIRINLTPQAMDMMNMAGPDGISAMAGMGRPGHQMVEEAPTELEGDPQDVKSLTLMVMPAMKMDNRHTASVESVRDVVAGLQLLMASRGHFDGPIDGFPEGEAFTGALRAFQAAQGLGRDDSLNFSTSLALFGLDSETMTTRYADRLALSESPVAMDTGLLGESAGRFSAGAPSLRRGNSPSDTVQIEISQREFTFAPDTIRIPAGRPVTLVIRNEGAIPHGFSAGRDPGNGHSVEDLFEGVDVEGSMSAMDMGMDMDMNMGGGDQGHDNPGTRVMTQVGETMKLSFTLPESRRGLWNVRCFLAGHSEAGMHGVLIVE